jgi:hypothetical protein
MKQKHGNNRARNAQIPGVIVYIYWDWRDQWLLRHATTRWSWEEKGAIGSHIKIKDCSRLSLSQQIRNIESSTKILREVYSRQRREKPTDLHTPQTLARHSSQHPGGKRKTRKAQKTTVPHPTLKITITQNRNCRKRECTQAPNTAVPTGNTRTKRKPAKDTLFYCRTLEHSCQWWRWKKTKPTTTNNWQDEFLSLKDKNLSHAQMKRDKLHDG